MLPLSGLQVHLLSPAGPSQPLGVVEQRVARREDEFHAVLRAQRAEALEPLWYR
jgi:hypothetical protein